MATSFKGWGSSWLDSWGGNDPGPPTGFMVGSASFSIAASLQVNAGEMQGSASFRFDAILGVGEPRFSQEIKVNRWYVKRDKKLHIFANASDADAFIEANEKADEAIAQAQKTSRLARKRLRDRIISVAPPETTVQIDYLAKLVSRYAIPVNLPELVVQQDWDRVMQIMEMALQAQDDEDIEMLLLA